MKVTELRIDDALVLSANSEELSGRERRLALEVLSTGDRKRLRGMSDARADSFLAGRLLVHAGLASLAPRLDLPPSTLVPERHVPGSDLPPSNLGMGFALRDGLQPIPKRENHPETKGWEQAPEQTREWARERGQVSEGGGNLMQAVALEVVCSRCGSSGHGKPSLPGVPVLVSIAYAGPTVFVALASADGCLALGIDAEALGLDSEKPALNSESPSPRVESDVECGPAGDLERWTVVEAVLKADGRGLRVDPAEVEFDGDALARVGDDDAAYRIHRTVIDDRFLVAVALRTIG